ncbi:histidine kinase [Microbulbifer bruguierae]|uniref:Histidine kinase n=1 Tax=Microbulbifer bruguierae TaxID=3029061 RepID=A0ABY8NFB6_9GAMM|nr:histidine kinase [Microbulbifer bruguierae]WGL17089.1 histidine kinase [Microbulbifer bruguierae]
MAESELRIAIDTIPGLVWTGLPDGSIDYLNRRWLDYTGLTQERAKGWGWQEGVHPEDILGLVEYWKSILASGIEGEYKARLRRYDGEYRWFLFRGVPLKNSCGEIVKWYGTNTDVEALHASEHVIRGQVEALKLTLSALSRESDPEEFLKHVIEMITSQFRAHSLSIWELKDDQNRVQLAISYSSNKLEIVESNGLYDQMLIPEGTDFHPVWSDFLLTGHYCVKGKIEEESIYICNAESSESKWHEWGSTDTIKAIAKKLHSDGVVNTLSVPIFLSGRVTGLISIRFTGAVDFRLEEIGLARALSQIATLAIQVMRLSNQIKLSAIINERNRLARDMHDTLAQGFTGIIIQLEAAVDARSKSLLKESQEHINAAIGLARESLGEARRSVLSLRQNVLMTKELWQAIEELFIRRTQGISLETKIFINGRKRSLPQGWDENILFMVNEALTNVLRHSNASEFRCDVYFMEKSLKLELVDNGRGVNQENGLEGFGLIGMKERVIELGGRFNLETEIGKFTAISIVLPLLPERVL